MAIGRRAGRQYQHHLETRRRSHSRLPPGFLPAADQSQLVVAVMKRFPPGRRSEQGVVLIIVLAVVLLITGLILAYLSRSGMERALANSSCNRSKADELARSALDIITG